VLEWTISTIGVTAVDELRAAGADTSIDELVEIPT
jgi:hypothetical protein